MEQINQSVLMECLLNAHYLSSTNKKYIVLERGFFIARGKGLQNNLKIIFSKSKQQMKSHDDAKLKIFPTLQ